MKALLAERLYRRKTGDHSKRDIETGWHVANMAVSIMCLCARPWIREHDDDLYERKHCLQIMCPLVNRLCAEAPLGELLWKELAPALHVPEEGRKHHCIRLSSCKFSVAFEALHPYGNVQQACSGPWSMQGASYLGYQVTYSS